MKTLLCLLSAGVLATAPVALHAKIVRTVEKTFSAQPGGQLLVRTQGGDIKVSTADVREVQIVARQTILADNDREADRLLERLTLQLKQEGDTITAEAKYGEKVSFWMGTWPPVRVDFIVTLPREFSVDLSASGNASGLGLRAGSIKAGISFDLNTSGGDIEVGSLKGVVKARTSGGDMRFARIDGDIDARTSGGDIHLEESTGSAKLGTSGGDVAVRRAGGPVEVSTSGGDIHLDAVAELTSATTSGGDIVAKITGLLKQDAVIRSSGGRVKVSVPRDAGFSLDASTSGGDVSAEGLTLTIAKGGIGKRRLIGSVNGGGAQLKLRSSGGDIVIRTE